MKKLLALLICLPAFFGVAKANPITLFDSLTGDDTFFLDPITDNSSYSALLASFSTGSGPGFLLSDVLLNLTAATPNDGFSSEVDLYDSSFNFLGTVGTIADSSLTGTPTVYSFAPTGTMGLDPNSQYWVVLIADFTNPSSAAWSVTDAWTDPRVSSEGIGDGFNGPYPFTNGDAGYAFEMQVDAQLTPEPSAFFLGGIGLAALAAFRRRRAIS